MRVMITVFGLVILLSACGGTEAQPTATAGAVQAPTAQPINSPVPEATAASATLPTEQPTQPIEPTAAATHTPEPTNAPDQVQPTPTVVVVPTDPPTPVPAMATPTSPLIMEGRISFRDNLAVADQLLLTMGNVAPPASGSVYEGWLIADDGVTEISTGVFEVRADGSVDYVWSSPTGENLIAKYSSFAVTIEPANDGDPHPTNQVAFRGAASPAVLMAARRVFAVNDGEPATPRNVSFGQGLLAQSQVARDHIFNAFNAAAIGALAEMRVHAEHVINIIEGTAGPRYADYNGDGRAENPGDGFGALVYARQIGTLLPGASADLGAIENLLVLIQDKGQEITTAADLASAQPLLDEFKTLAEQLVNVAVPTYYHAAQAAVSYPVMPTP